MLSLLIIFYRLYDTNNDGYIEFREFLLLVYILSKGSPEENLEQIFKLLDEDNSGEISMKEFKQVVHDMFLLANVEDISQSVQELLVEKAFIEMYRNDDGKVTMEEFVAACLGEKKFSKMLTVKLIDVFVE